MKGLLEIGTNSIKCMAFRRVEDKFEFVVDKQVITQLGEGYLKSALISKEALSRTCKELKKAKKELLDLGCQEIDLIGTMILRRAENREMVVKQISEDLGLELKVLTGEEEAQYSFKAAVRTLALEGDEKILVVDSGGGSSEAIFGEKGKILHAQSIDIGAVTLTEKFNLDNVVSHEIIMSCEQYVNRVFTTLDKEYQCSKLVVIGGSATTVSAMIQELDPYDSTKVQGSIVAMEQLFELQDKVANLTTEQRKELVGLSPKRANIILGGIIIIGCILDRSNIREMIVCDRGLRYGYAYSMMEE